MMTGDEAPTIKGVIHTTTNLIDCVILDCVGK